MSEPSRRRRAIILVLIVLGSVVAGAAVAQFLSNSVPVSGPVPIVAPDGPNATVTGSADINMTNPWPDDNTVELNTSKGNITFISNGRTNLSIAADEINGTWTNVSSLDVSSNELQIIPEDKPAANISGNATALSLPTSMAVDDSTVDFVYSSGGGPSDITVRSLPATTEIAAIDASSNAVLAVATTDGSGTVTFTNLDSGDHDVLLQTGGNAPTLSNPSPSGEVTSQVTELSIDVNDTDFPGDEVQVNFWLDGSQVDSVNATSNGTVTTSSFSSLDLGSHTWAANVTDAFGENTVEATDFSLPSNLTFRNESNASQIITGVNATVTFYSDDGTTVIRKSDDDDDGNVSLEGLPDKEFVIVVEADGFYDRRVYIESIFNQQNIYLLNSTAFPNAIATTFVYEDRTGDFPNDETTLRIQRAVDVNNDGNFSFQTVAGDFWGAAGEFPFTGETNERYRLIIENGQGTQRDLGTHIPTADGTKNIIVGKLSWPAANGTARNLDAELQTDTQSILVTYFDPAENTTDVRIRVWELGNESNIIHDQTYSSGPYGTLNVNVSGLTANQTDMSWVVNSTATTTDSGSTSLQVPVGSSPFATGIVEWLLGTVMWIFITFVACLYGPRTAVLGAWVVVLFAGMAMVLQLVYIPTASLIVAGAVAAGGTLYREAMP